MSRCHFPHENHTIILDFPSFSNINSTMQLIQTHKNFAYTSALSLSFIDQQLGQSQQIHQNDQDSLALYIQNQQAKSHNHQQQQQQFEQNKKKKTTKSQGCTCKKTNCLKMYCECFSMGKMCLPQCSCYGCYNHQQFQNLIQQAKQQLKQKGIITNRHTDRSCNCKKSQCQKKYCQCYNAGFTCTQSCNCNDCCNKQIINHQEYNIKNCNISLLQQNQQSNSN